jgi:hypothetical protein
MGMAGAATTWGYITASWLPHAHGTPGMVAPRLCHPEHACV